MPSHRDYVPGMTETGTTTMSERGIRLLFLCTGNACRSQMAEGFARAKQKPGVEILSAGMARQMVTIQKGSHGLGPSLEGTGPLAAFGHGGSNVGFKCAMTAFVGGGRGAVVMTNGDQGGRLASEILRAVAAEYGWQTRQPREKAVVTVAPDALGRLTAGNHSSHLAGSGINAAEAFFGKAFTPLTADPHSIGCISHGFLLLYSTGVRFHRAKMR